VFLKAFAVIPGVAFGFGYQVLLKKFVVSEVFPLSNVEYLLDQNIQKNSVFTRNLNA
jgi:hypothetical protein